MQSRLFTYLALLIAIVALIGYLVNYFNLLSLQRLRIPTYSDISRSVSLKCISLVKTQISDEANYLTTDSYQDKSVIYLLINNKTLTIKYDDPVPFYSIFDQGNYLQIVENSDSVLIAEFHSGQKERNYDLDGSFVLDKSRGVAIHSIIYKYIFGKPNLANDITYFSCSDAR